MSNENHNPKNSTREASSPWITLMRLSRYLWPKGRRDLQVRVVVAVFLLLASKVLNVGVPFILKDLIDHFSVPNLALLPIGLLIAYGVGRLGTQAFGELRDLVFAKVSQHVQRYVAMASFKHLHGLSLAFHLARHTGGISRSIERGVKGIQFVLQFMIFNILPTLVEIVFVTVILIYAFDWRYAAIIFATIIFYILYTLTVTEWRTQYRREMNDKDTEANSKAVDSLLNFETVKYFGNEDHEYARYDQALAGYERAAVRSQTTLSMLNIGQGFIIAIGLIAVMALAGWEIVQKTRTVGDFVLVNTYLIQLYLPLNFLGFVYREMKLGLIDMDKMFELLNIEADVKDKPNAPDMLATEGVVEFKNVSFAYDPRRPILKDVSFRVPQGSTVAIVGPSGAGKSTIARLLFRFYDVQSGAILIDQVDVRDVKQKSVRRQIGIVPQDTVLFNDTIYYNILYGNPLATKDEVIEASRLAKIHDFVEQLPDAYASRVGERGLKLSGGEKQRVAIARTILKDPKILVFDEATSALDSKTEREIQKSLLEVSEKRTTLIIAHRLSTVVHAEEIIVLDGGKIVERGRHEELLDKKGLYKDMWDRQQQAGYQQTESHQARPI